jgi:hypothetical protein
MQDHSSDIPNFCPVCGGDSVTAYTRLGALHLFRCGSGHWFFFELLEAETPQKK